MDYQSLNIRKAIEKKIMDVVFVTPGNSKAIYQEHQTNIQL